MAERGQLGLAPSDYSTLPPGRACLGGVDKSDIVLGLLSARYGGIQKSSGLSATHEELRHALRENKCVLVFVDTGTVPEPLQKKLIDEVSGWIKGRILVKFPFGDHDRFAKELSDRLKPLAQDQVELGLIDSHLSEEEAKNLYFSFRGLGSSQCCAFLAGDWSILEVKRVSFTPRGRASACGNPSCKARGKGRQESSCLRKTESSMGPKSQILGPNE